MKTAAIICEYNPFHNGHKHQLELAKKDFDAVICIMSGSFTQRGDIAVYSKHSRARAAVENGADIVFELPVRYSLSSAEGFASGAVFMICSMGICDALIFGSECDDIQALSDAASAMINETPQISRKIKENLSLGMGYPAARAKAYEGIIQNDLLSLPNNILGIEYIMALQRLDSGIVPITHPRSAGHFDKTEKNGFSSAYHIREKLRSGEDISSLTPYDFSGLEKYDINRLTDIFKYLLISRGDALFSEINDAEPGICNLFMKHYNCATLDELVSACVTKRYTRSRLLRTALRAILDIKGGYRDPSYLRLLAASETGCSLLSRMKDTASLPIITKTAECGIPDFAEEVRATDIAALCADRPVKKGRDFTESPIIKKL